jgi:hypothetical protein
MSNVSYELYQCPEFVNLLANPESDASENLKVKKCGKTGFRFISYKKSNLTDENRNILGLYRSVLVNSSNEIVSFSPPKSIPVESLNWDNVVAEDFVEGTMINLFFDTSKNAWEMCTRSCVGGKNRFFQGAKSFHDMFMQAVVEMSLRSQLDTLPKENCYSFVLKHPENRIVRPIVHASIVLVEAYHIDVATGIVTVLDRTSFGFPTPQFIPTRSLDELKSAFAADNTSINIMGLILRDSVTNQRSKLRNPNYERAKALRGNQPKLQYQFLSLYKENKVAEYLHFFAEDWDQISNYMFELQQFAQPLYLNYVQCFIRHEMELKNYGPKWKPILYLLHQYYLTTLKPVNQRVTLQCIMDDFLKTLETPLLMHHINFQFKV